MAKGIKGILARLSLSEDSKAKHTRFVFVYVSAGLGMLALLIIFIACWLGGMSSSQLGSVAGLCWVSSIVLVPFFAFLRAHLITPFVLAFGVSSTVAFAVTVIHAGMTEYE